ncbi:MAG: hypothetical protein K940chlam9_01598 [Chlamydiae bacterium]|nr:hypothetical protein [Chlamydiota bacterium]
MTYAIGVFLGKFKHNFTKASKVDETKLGGILKGPLKKFAISCLQSGVDYNSGCKNIQNTKSGKFDFALATILTTIGFVLVVTHTSHTAGIVGTAFAVVSGGILGADFLALMVLKVKNRSEEQKSLKKENDQL